MRGPRGRFVKDSIDETDEFDDEKPETTADGRPVHRHVVRDLASAVKIRRADAKAQQAKAKLEGKKEALRYRVELQKIKLQTTARETAAKHLATFAGLYMTVMVLAFLLAVKFIEEAHIAVVAGLITLVVTSVSALLRSIVTESNGAHHEDEPGNSKKDRSDG